MSFNKQIFFSQNKTSAPVNPCNVWDLTAALSPCYAWESTQDVTGLTGFGATADSIKFNSDGSSFFVTKGSFQEDIVQFDLTTNWDISDGIVLNQTYTIPQLVTDSANANGFDFSPDGLTLILGARYFNDGKLHKYSLSTAFDISTLSFVATSPLLGEYLVDLNILSGGSVLIGNKGGVNLVQYALSTPYDVTTASKVRENSSIISRVWVRSDGLRIYGVQGVQYNLSTPYDISTAAGQSGTITTNGDDGVFFKSDGTKFWVTGVRLTSEGNVPIIKQYGYIGT